MPDSSRKLPQHSSAGHSTTEQAAAHQAGQGTPLTANGAQVHWPLNDLIVLWILLPVNRIAKHTHHIIIACHAGKGIAAAGPCL